MSGSVDGLRAGFVKFGVTDLLPSAPSELEALALVAGRAARTATGDIEAFARSLMQPGTASAMIYDFGKASSDYLAKAAASSSMAPIADATTGDLGSQVGTSLVVAVGLLGAGVLAVVGLIAALEAAEFFVAALIVALILVYLKSGLMALASALRLLGSAIAAMT